ncbi:MAG: ribose 5-phosphate isomerase B [Bacteroidetes bacterium]|jgi:ribose 5-phosphate isomerase B|nr:ribose 5-phosphate isomerase B [Bacteroidota bacterium]
MLTSFNIQLPIAIGCDHAGFEYKQQIIDWLQHSNFIVKDFGTNSLASVDYPDFAHPVASSVENSETAFGILLCGSANGVAITANKHQHIRAGLCWNNEVAKLVRQHNNANIICIPARFVTLETAIDMINIFMQTNFEGGRHQNRIDKINC